MQIAEYRDRNGLSREDFAKRVNVTAEAVRLWELRQREPSPKKVFEIEAATDGSISRHDLRPDLWPSPTTDAGAAA